MIVAPADRSPRSAARIPVGAAFGKKMSNSWFVAEKCQENLGFAGNRKPYKCSASDAE
jgi:hypothetical protein